VLAVTSAVVLASDARAARTAARAWIVPYCRAENYQASLAEQGFTAADWEPPYSDRLVDEVVTWGDEETVRARIAALHAAGADHVAVIPLATDGSTEHLPTLEALAPAG
jgi:alkanesulfonate monooxygenase SsuD/methylene tetrahydromethanopterin reductase-like flavin-dependent oxidoreductase (luciferase family)